MNYIFGSASGIGNCLYKLYKQNNKMVLGVDIVPTSETDIITDLTKNEDVQSIINLMQGDEIESITYCAGIQVGDDNLEIYTVNVLSFIQIIENTISNFNNTVVCAFSSVHSKASNKDNVAYASSKASLESSVNTFSTNNTNSYFYFVRLGATDTELLRENVNDIEKLIKSLPSGKSFEPENVAELIYDVNTKHKTLFNGGHLQIDQGVLSKLSTE